MHKYWGVYARAMFSWDWGTCARNRLVHTYRIKSEVTYRIIGAPVRLVLVSGLIPVVNTRTYVEI